MALINDPQVRAASLHNPLPRALHTYLWPFIIIWPIYLSIYFRQESYDKYIGGPEWAFVFTGSIFTVQSLLWLSTKWNVHIQAIFTSTASRAVETASLIKVLPVANAGVPEIVKLERDVQDGVRNTSFVFQKRRFLYDKEAGSFAPLQFAIDGEPKPSIGTYQSNRGITSSRDVEQIQRYYGDNTFDIPVPTFTELFKEHAVAPFFVFQVFCVGLWMLDEYWYYSLFTLFMLFTFESTVVWQRQRTLNEFRGMGIKPYPIWVHRNKGWEEIQSDKLLPGDLVSLGRTKEDSGVACDMLLVEGTAIVNEAMLSGESTPVLKDSIQLRPSSAHIEPEGVDKNAFIYGGTKVLQVSRTAPGAEGEDNNVTSGVKPAPDNGAMAIITKTGFETSQGILVRTMIYSTERVSANNVEALLFILFLLMFAIAASWYVWTSGVENNRKRSKLMLDCVIIITSVVPPELPMELSLAVNTSLAALSKLAIFCTEPFRIPFAGRVDIACFDKTGTLTGEDLVVEGIGGLDGATDRTIDQDAPVTPQLHSIMQAPPPTVLALASAHALVKLEDGEIVGEPMEKATLSYLGWSLDANDTLRSKSLPGAKEPSVVQIKRRFQFSSSLKRQSSVATIQVTNRETGKRSRSTFVGVKGAPETIRKFLVDIPPNYDETYKYFTRNGRRVLALAYKFISRDQELGQNKINSLEREDVEGELRFAGFLVLQCPLKDDAMKAVRMLNESSHRVIMITGDNPLTAVHVARQVEIIDREALILDAPEDDDSGDKLVFRSVDETINIPVDPTQDLDPEILKSKDICVTGYAYAKIKDQKALKQLLEHTWAYARVSPKQKEEILLALKELGYTTLMCGDGTNDVGALKQAHIGVALLNGTKEALDKIAENFRNTKLKDVYEKQAAMMKRWNQQVPPVPLQIAHLYPPGPTNPHYEKAMEREAERRAKSGKAEEKKDENTNGSIETITSPGAQALQNAEKQEQENQLTPQELRKKEAQDRAAGFASKMTEAMADFDDSEPPTIKLGDASVAAPFTSKLANVIAIPNIIRQGRCTLVATIQMYKILALNCLISAYSLSVLYIDGIKFGDWQYTISGMLMSVCFLSISRAKPVEQLSKERPQNNIFNMYIIGSVLGQFAVHIVTLIYISQYVQTKEAKPVGFDLDDDKRKFEPSLLNSAIYLLQLIQQISTFAINYQGRPFRESLSENKTMYYGIVMTAAIAFSCATEFIPELNSRMSLVPFETAFKVRLTATMLLDYVACYGIEKSLKYLYSDFRPKEIAMRRPDQLKIEEGRRQVQFEKEEREKERLRDEQQEARRKAYDAWKARRSR